VVSLTLYAKWKAVKPDEPRITKQPVGDKVDKRERLTLTIKATAKGKLTYQWYRGSSPKGKNAKRINGAKGTKYKVPTSKRGVLYYHCVVTNTENGQKATKTSKIVKITVR